MFSRKNGAHGILLQISGIAGTRDPGHIRRIFSNSVVQLGRALHHTLVLPIDITRILATVGPWDSDEVPWPCFTHSGIGQGCPELCLASVRRDTFGLARYSATSHGSARRGAHAFGWTSKTK